MIMFYCIAYAILVLVLGILVFNKEVTLTVLNNISFKWIFEKKQSDEVKKSETSFAVKEFKNVSESHFSKYLGIRLICVGAFMLMVVGISWMFADFQYVKEIGTKVYMDAPNTGRMLVVFECIVTGVFTLVMVVIGTKWSNDKFEHSIVAKHASGK